MAQLVAQLIRNQQVKGSSPFVGSRKNRSIERFFCALNFFGCTLDALLVKTLEKKTQLFIAGKIDNTSRTIIQYCMNCCVINHARELFGIQRRQNQWKANIYRVYTGEVEKAGQSAF